MVITKGGGRRRGTRRFPSSSSLVEDGVFRREKGEFFLLIW
jgi:hypothetical protein